MSKSTRELKSTKVPWLNSKLIFSMSRKRSHASNEKRKSGKREKHANTPRKLRLRRLLKPNRERRLRRKDYARRRQRLNDCNGSLRRKKQANIRRSRKRDSKRIMKLQSKLSLID